MKSQLFLFILLTLPSLLLIGKKGEWLTVETIGEPHARHECAFVESGGKFYLLGGRRVQPVDIYDPGTGKWTMGAKPPMELHHFQPVPYQGKIYMLGAMTGKFPDETPIGHILIYDPATDQWEKGDKIPRNRRRGGAGAVLHEGKIYLVGGIQRGHQGGYVNWFDVYDPETGAWEVLPDAPHARDHFAAAIVGQQLVAAGGRTTSLETKQVFQLTVAPTDVYDFETGQWTVGADIPTPRAGTMAVGVDSSVVVVGGESGEQKVAHDEVEAYDPLKNAWKAWPSLVRGRHGAGVFQYGMSLYVCSGSGNRGGSPELTTMERLDLTP